MSAPQYEIIGVIVRPVAAATSTGCGGGITALVIALFGWVCAGIVGLKVGVLIPGIDIEQYEPESAWIPPWLDLWPDPRTGLFISSDERNCYAKGYDFSACPANLREAALQAREDSEAAPVPPTHAETGTGLKKVKITHNCNLRPAASGDGQPISLLGAGEECDMTQRSGAWTKVNCPSGDGWVGKACLN